MQQKYFYKLSLDPMLSMITIESVKCKNSLKNLKITR